VEIFEAAPAVISLFNANASPVVRPFDEVFGLRV
jgi:hypothetical protein